MSDAFEDADEEQRSCAQENGSSDAKDKSLDLEFPSLSFSSARTQPTWPRTVPPTQHLKHAATQDSLASQPDHVDIAKQDNSQSSQLLESSSVDSAKASSAQPLLPATDSSTGPVDPSNPFAPRETTCDTLVVDTAGFLKHCVLETMAKRIITVPDVIAEVRDKGARDRLQLLPFEIEVREPSPESIKEVISFAKLTGDFVSLSPTDIRVMALTLMLEVSVNGSDHLHKIPKPPPTPGSIEKPCRYGFDCTRPDCWFQHTAPAEVAPEVADQDDDWITPDNYQTVADNLMRVTTSRDARCKVACLTTDFSMQNVLLQMGIRVLSVDGLLVRTVKCFALRCSSCGKVERNPEREFCFFCGNPSLMKVSMIIESDGSVRYGVPKASRISTRGTKYSIPKPKGGRSEAIILREDQREYQRPARKEKQYDIFSDDYAVVQAPFAKSKAFNKGPVIGVGRKNPNESHRKRR